MMTLAEQFKAQLKADYESVMEFLAEIEAIDASAEVVMHKRKPVVHFSDDSTYTIGGEEPP